MMALKSLRLVLAALLIIATAAFLHARSHGEIFASRLPLQSFPQQLGPWTGTDVPIDKDALQVLGPGDFLLRVYANQQQPYADLFIAYFPSQRMGDTIHSPKNCLPGAGWAPVRSDHIMLSMPGHEPFRVNRYVMHSN